MDASREAAAWFVLRVKPGREKAASQLLEANGHVAFLPLYQQDQDGARELDLVLFPGYVFCQFNGLARLPLLHTPGVIGLVGEGSSTPIPVDQCEIHALQTAVLARLPIQPHPFLHTGARVRITRGSLAGLEGIVMDFRNSLRLLLSITLLRRSVLVEIDRNLFRADGHPASNR